MACLLVADEEWRTTPFVHVEAFAGWDACLCFEAGQLLGGEEALIVRRKGAGTVRVLAHGRAAHSGSAPDRGRNALLALSAAAQAVAGCHDPDGPDRLTAVPTVMTSGDAFNVVPAAGELLCDVRSDRLAAIESVREAVPPELGGVRLEVELRAPLAAHGFPRDHRGAARPDREGRRSPGGAVGARRCQRRQPLRPFHPRHRRRPRARAAARRTTRASTCSSPRCSRGRRSRSRPRSPPWRATTRGQSFFAHREPVRQ